MENRYVLCPGTLLQRRNDLERCIANAPAFVERNCQGARFVFFPIEPLLKPKIDSLGQSAPSMRGKQNDNRPGCVVQSDFENGALPQHIEPPRRKLKSQLARVEALHGFEHLLGPQTGIEILIDQRRVQTDWVVVVVPFGGMSGGDKRVCVDSSRAGWTAASQRRFFRGTGGCNSIILTFEPLPSRARSLFVRSTHKSCV